MTALSLNARLSPSPPDALRGSARVGQFESTGGGGSIGDDGVGVGGCCKNCCRCSPQTAPSCGGEATKLLRRCTSALLRLRCLDGVELLRGDGDTEPPRRPLTQRADVCTSSWWSLYSTTSSSLSTTSVCFAMLEAVGWSKLDLRRWLGLGLRVPPAGLPAVLAMSELRRRARAAARLALCGPLALQGTFGGLTMFSCIRPAELGPPCARTALCSVRGETARKCELSATGPKTW